MEQATNRQKSKISSKRKNNSFAANSLYNRQGQRKYLTPLERRLFLQAACTHSDDIQLFARTLLETGCRISEALSLKRPHIDEVDQVIIIPCLKKRQSGIFRAVPVSPGLIAHLTSYDEAQSRLWPWCRMTGYRRVKEIMKTADITGPQATPKGLRHGFAVAAIDVGIPLNMVQRWLGHADMATTAIYAHAMGQEERNIAKRLWEDMPDITKT